MSIDVQVTTTSNLGQILPRLRANVVKGEDLAAERLLALSAAIVPFDEGTLVGSGSVENASDPNAGASVVYDTPYAARLHEHPEYNFQNGRQGKYLETPALENKDELGAIIAKQVNSA